MCWVMPPASPDWTFSWRMRSSRLVLPWSTWPMTVTTDGFSSRPAGASSGRTPPGAGPAGGPGGRGGSDRRVRREGGRVVVGEDLLGGGLVDGPYLGLHAELVRDTLYLLAGERLREGLLLPERHEERV